MASSAQTSVEGKDRPADLPDFKRPPLIEVVLGVQFSELRDYRTHHVGALWNSKFRDQFPTCVERPPLSATFETFGSTQPIQPRLQILEVPGPTVLRQWFINSDETELIQIQADRFLHNWRRKEDNPLYPRYELIREKFFKELAKLESFFQEEDIGSIEPNQCEITYVNHISLSDKSDPRLQFHRIFRFWNSFDREPAQQGERLPVFEDGRFHLRFVIKDPESGEPRGRLHIEAQPAIKDDDTQIITLNVTARGSPASPTFPGVADFLDIGRDAIVRGFTAITTSEMHEHWELIK